MESALYLVREHPAFLGAKVVGERARAHAPRMHLTLHTPEPEGCMEPAVYLVREHYLLAVELLAVELLSTAGLKKSNLACACPACLRTSCSAEFEPTSLDRSSSC